MSKYSNLLIAFLCAACGSSEISENYNYNSEELIGDIKPTGKVSNKASRRTTSNNTMIYHGGPILLGTTNIYYIWYGNWANNSAPVILADLANNIGGSPYYNINTTYYNSLGEHVSNSVLYAGSTIDSYSRGSNLSDLDIQAIVNSAVTNSLPLDYNGVYFVLTSSDVREVSGFCTAYCGWHTYTGNIKYAFVGNPEQCPSACAAQTNSPNNNLGADAMASIIIHELEEAVTDPLLNAWYTRRGYENADICAWQFGSTYTVSNGSKANMKLGTRDYLIQSNWVNTNNGYCALKY